MATDQSEGRRKLLFQLFLRTGRVESEQVIHLGQLPWSCLVVFLYARGREYLIFNVGVH